LYSINNQSLIVHWPLFSETVFLQKTWQNQHGQSVWPRTGWSMQPDFACSMNSAFFSYFTLNQTNNMRKIIGFIAMAAIVFTACESKKEGTSAAEAPKGSGYTLDSSANIDLVKKVNYAFPAGDSTVIYACYNDTAKVHDNLHGVSIKENFRDFHSLMAKGLTFKVEKINGIFEVVNYKPWPNGVSNHVVAWVTLLMQKAGKSITVVMNQGFAIKDGKIVEEWDSYDTAGLMDLLK
jgi:hypothetical protein